jgi:dTDP-4-amino-4,6-dideoxygalactose transaminase
LKVSLLNLVRQHEPYKARLLGAIEEVINSGRFILGPKVQELEKRIAEYTGSQFAVGCASGTDALHLAVRALDVGPGDAVITSPYTFFASAESVSLAGARPLFVDIELDTYNLDVTRLEEFCSRQCDWNGQELIHKVSKTRIKSIMPVHLFGQCADMKGIMATAARYRLAVIEDAAQSIGAQQMIDGKWVKSGAIGTIGCFSFFPSKNLSALGDAGMAVTSSPELRDRLAMLRGHGAKPKYFHHFIGLNSRLDELQAAVLLVKFDYLEALNAKRQELFRYYTEQLAGVVTTPVIRDANRSVLNQYVIRHPRRDALMSFLKEHGVATEVYYPLALHLQKCYASLGYRAGDFPNAEQASRESLALPIDPLLAPEERSYVVETLKAFRAG